MGDVWLQLAEVLVRQGRTEEAVAAYREVIQRNSRDPGALIDMTVRHRDDLQRALVDVATDTSTYYVLAYAPENLVLDGKYRRITLKTKWAGLDIRARRGYVATPLPQTRQLRTK